MNRTPHQLGVAVFYVRRGSVPHKRHTQHRAPDGSLYAEELFGVEGFTGRSSPPLPPRAADADAQIENVRDVGRSRPPTTALHRHRLVKTGDVPEAGDVVDRPHPALLQQRRA